MTKLALAALCFLSANSRAASDMLASVSVLPPASPSGSLLTVSMVVVNPNAGQVDNVIPQLLYGGAASAAPVVGPSPTSQSIAGGNGSGSFTWVFSSSGCGSLVFSGGASGTDGSGAVNSNWHAATAVSAQCTPSPTPTITPTHTETPWVVYVTRIVPEVGDATILGNIFHPLVSGSLELRYDLPFEGKVSISIYNRLGQLVKNIEKDANSGRGSEFWDGRSDKGSLAGAGIYLAHFRAKGLSKVVKFVIVK